MLADKSTSHDDTLRRVRELGPWFHNLRLEGVETAPDHFLGDYPSFKWRGFRHVLPEDMSGMSVLDIGCNAGFYSFEMIRRNAARVVGIDEDERYLSQARFAAGKLGVDLELRRMSVYDVASLRERFDLVIFMGVFYHLRHPLLALDLIHEHVAEDLLLFQSLMRGCRESRKLSDDYAFDDEEIFDRPAFPKLHFVEKNYAGDPTNWFIPNAGACEAMLRSSGFEIRERPETEVYLCKRNDSAPWRR
ncbi:MAG: TIGR04290 family methyltransferase [Rhizobiaceae bacterium]|nr:TIGR04290 family methyltransferase [Rhizobiaceae bacterium]MCV0407469.1 TIGR04290 family methyltransferase [Rhizobiaceae bacterium]